MYLYDLNWRERKDVMLASFATTPREEWTSSYVLQKKAQRERKEYEKQIEKENKKEKGGGSKGGGHMDGEQSGQTTSSLRTALASSPSNIFSKLKEYQMDCLTVVISYI